MSTELATIRTMLQTTQRLLAHQEEVKKLRGESFNIFSILKMESLENQTHSAFLGELLNPKGSHLQGSLFLSLFLDTINYNAHHALDLDTVQLRLEHHIGTVTNATGGRIDIYIWDAAGNSISIENKIDAGDQENQIQRYVNYNKGHNTVYYLTREGRPASSYSSGELIEGRDYFSISYKDTILRWLERCHKESTEQAILRESIKQYIILVKKMTNQLIDSKMEREIEDLIRSNYRAAKVMASGILSVEISATYKFMIEVRDVLLSQLSETWIVTLDDDISQSWKGISISHNSWNGVKVRLEGNSKMPWGNNHYGILAPEKEYDRVTIKERLKTVVILEKGFLSDEHWPFYRYLLDFATDENRSVLFDDARRTILVQEIANKLLELARICKHPLGGIERLKN